MDYNFLIHKDSVKELYFSEVKNFEWDSVFFFQFGSLESIVITSTNTNQIPNWINRIKIKSLKILYSRDLKIDTNLFHHPHLEFIQFNGCNIKELPKKITVSNSRLKTLDLSNNQIQKIYMLFLSTFHNLKHFLIANNKLDEIIIDCQFENKTLTSLILTNNNLENFEFQDITYFFPNIERLQISRNKYTKNGDYSLNLTHLTNLKVLFIGEESVFDINLKLQLPHELDILTINNKLNKLTIKSKTKVVYFVCHDISKVKGNYFLRNLESIRIEYPESKFPFKKTKKLNFVDLKVNDNFKLTTFQKNGLRKYRNKNTFSLNIFGKLKTHEKQMINERLGNVGR